MARYKFYIVLYCKSVFILVQCNTSQNKIYVAHSITAVCVIGWIWEKEGCLPSLALCAYEISRRQRIFHEFAFDNEVLKTFVEFQICWKRSNVVEFEFELCHISTQKLMKATWH